MRIPYIPHILVSISPPRLFLILILSSAFIFFVLDMATYRYSIDLVTTMVIYLANLHFAIMTAFFLLLSGILGAMCFPNGIIFLSGGYIYTMKLGLYYGFIVATLMNLIGNCLGCAISYRVAMYIVTDHSKPLDRKDFHPILWGIRKALEKKGRYINTLLRLTPIIPGAVLNYCLPSLGSKFEDFIFGAFFGTIPYAMVLSMLGTVLNDATPMEKFLYHTSAYITIPLVLVGGGSLFTGLYLLYRYASEALQSVVDEDSNSADADKRSQEMSLLGSSSNVV